MNLRLSPNHRKQKRSFPVRELLLITIFVLTFPLVVYISTLPPQRFRNEITEWGDHRSETYKDFSDYREKFGVNEYVIVTWPGCDLDDPRVDAVAEKIERDLADSVTQVSSGLQVYRELRDRTQLNDEATLDRLRNCFISKSGIDTAVGFNLTEAARNNRREVMEQLNKVLHSSGIDAAECSFAGLGYDLFVLDKEGLESPFRMVPMIMLLCFLLTIILTRNILLAVFINALGSFTGCLAFNIVYLADVDMNAIIWPLPTLTMLLTVSASLHFLSYFRKAAEQHDSGGLPNDQPAAETSFALDKRRTIAAAGLRLALKPTLCCSLTTAIGLLSLLLSTSQPVRQFGIFGALSILAANALLLLWFPPFLTLIHYARTCTKRRTRNESASARDGWQWLTRFTRTFRKPILVVCGVLLIWCATGIRGIRTGSDLETFLPAGHPVLSDAAVVERATGPLNSIELILKFHDCREENDKQRIREIESLCSAIVEQTPIGSCISVAIFAPEFRDRLSPIQRVSQTVRIRQLKKELVKSGLLHLEPDSNRESWRISCRYSSRQQIDPGRVTNELTSMAQRQFDRDGSPVLEGEQFTVATTGEFVLFDYVDKQFFRELLLTYSTAFIAITIVVLIVLRTTRAWLVALLPNLFPAVVVLGIAGHLGVSLDVATLMTASVALGIAVDDTLHFLLWHKELISVGAAPDQNEPVHATQHDSSSAIESTMRYCGRAMLQTSLILGGSIILYAFCGFLPTVRFGILLSAMMLAALVGDLILLPALLHSGSHASKQSNS